MVKCKAYWVRTLGCAALIATSVGLSGCSGSDETAVTTPPPPQQGQTQQADTEGGFVFGKGGWFDFGGSEPARPQQQAQGQAAPAVESPTTPRAAAPTGQNAQVSVQASTTPVIPTPPPGVEGGIGVNALLWRATLNTLSFMPLAKADPFSGIYATDWFSPAASPQERVKVTVYILDTKLRADAIKAAVFRQSRDASGQWADAQVSPDTTVKIENAILNRARELRSAEE